MQKLKNIVLTGGGTAGHVMPHLAMLPLYRENGITVRYIGSNGVEKELMSSGGVEFHTIRTGKLRRYLSFQNALDVLNVLVGTMQSLLLLKKIRPQVVFSKGGFVSVPVCVAAWILRIPVLSHESDYSPGLATKLIAPFAKTIFCTFDDTARYLPSHTHAMAVGTPIRPEIFTGNAERGFVFTGLDPSDNRRIVLVMGGTQGAQRINDLILSSLNELLKSYRIIHLCGRGKLPSISAQGYVPFEFVGKELPDLLAMADLVISRAGANTLFELLSLRKPMLLIPLEIGSRGDQVHNSNYFVKNGWARSIRETEISPKRFTDELVQLMADAAKIKDRQESFSPAQSSNKIYKRMTEVARA